MTVHPVAVARGWAKSFGGPFTLRRRLVLSIVAISALLAILIGALSVVVLQRVLSAQLDAQLTSAVARASGQDGRNGFGGSGADTGGPNQAPGTVTIYYSGSAASATSSTLGSGLVLESGRVGTVSSATKTALSNVATGDKSEEIQLGSSYGSYLVRAVPVTVQLPSGSFVQARVVVGLPRDSVTGPVGKLIAGIAIIAAAGIAAAIFFAMITVKYALGPLQRMAETAARVAEMPLDRGEVALDARVPEEDTDTRTEVGRVGAAMNRMLGHVSHALTARQESENKVRQFVADASHELRTPLASVRGYAELTRRMGKDLPEDVVYAMGRIESESVRMTSLVEELLLLARLDEGTDLVKKEVDLTRIVLDAVHDTHVQATEHQYDVSVPEVPITLLGDPMRLHQVVANLLANARTHTPDGTEVWVSLERDDTTHEAIVTVSDNGPGIDPAVMPVLFERFARADSSRSRKAGSTGLGLAIVHAVVHSHGGTVTATNGDPGAVFTVRLPLERAPQGRPVPLPAPEPVRS
ncbi:two-component system OmpR family sensor kinase [Frondihabitans sp. PhB188]|uniref:sensor histidine kinase n=1 Tax=Frondihabitans sp. PhB188 TaxID=2485200 RepID=UPI000F46116C|nr:HAMP domain-containing sensor histidine kinase [Frondihabitans sp. PhB188]ROQ36765.1 two-component system OmpR family sensor kinase [Frondihabitans sp. PhB188]